MIARLYRALGATHDERLTNLIALVLCVAIPFLFAGAIAGLPTPQ